MSTVNVYSYLGVTSFPWVPSQYGRVFDRQHEQIAMVRGWSTVISWGVMDVTLWDPSQNGKFWVRPHMQ